MPRNARKAKASKRSAAAAAAVSSAAAPTSSPPPPAKRAKGKGRAGSGAAAQDGRAPEAQDLLLRKIQAERDVEDENVESDDDEEDESSQDELGDGATSDGVAPKKGGAKARKKRNASSASSDSPVQRSRRPLSPYQAPVDGYESGGKKRKTAKPGILYLSSIPPGYNVSQTIAFFAQYGQLGRVYLQPDLMEKAKSKDNMARNFTEGWIEFCSKRDAKEVAEHLNCTQVGGKKRSKAYGVLWNIKYLRGFTWGLLMERLALEKATHQQKMRVETSQAKREAEFFKEGVEKSKRMDRKNRKRGKSKEEEEGANNKDGSMEESAASARKYFFREKDPDEVVRKRTERRKSGELPVPSLPVAASSSSPATKEVPVASGGKKPRGSKKGEKKAAPKAAPGARTRERAKSKEEADRAAVLKGVFGATD